MMTRRELLLLLGGAPVAVSLTAHAQQKAMPVIGYLSSSSEASVGPNLPAFHQGLSETGYVDGQNLAIDYRWAEGRYDRLPTLVADLIGRNVDLIFAGGGPSAIAAKNTTATIPIVFLVGIDPVATGLVASLARPGGNLTGISLLINELMSKRLELLSELVPRASAIALLVNPTSSVAAERITRDLQEAAQAKGVQLRTPKATTESEIDAAFASLVGLQVGALVVGADVFFNSRRAQFVALASRHAVPAIYQGREFALAGGLITYGTKQRFGGWYTGVIGAPGSCRQFPDG
jgi:putative tryptophan/tyrosine transport system substrate-binding protein